MSFIEKILLEKGPLISSELIKILINEYPNITENNARQRIKRQKAGSENILVIDKLFEKNKYLYYRRDIDEVKLAKEIIKELKKNGKQYYNIINMLQLHFNKMDKDFLPIYSINPIKPLKGHLLFDKAIENLIQKNIIISDEKFYVLDEKYRNPDAFSKDFLINQITTNLIVKSFVKLIKKIGFVSYKSVKTPGEYANFRFHISAPSYIGNLVTYVKENKIPCFVLIDIVYVYKKKKKKLEKKDISFFVDKINTIKNISSYRAKFIPFLLVESLESNAFIYLKENGVVVGLLNELFGDSYSRQLSVLASFFSKIDSEDLTKIEELILKKKDGFIGNIKGLFFEIISYYINSKNYPVLELRKQFKIESRDVEIDIFGTKHKEIFFCECKSGSKKITLDDFKKWFKNIIQLSNNSVYKGNKVIAEYWTLRGFEDDVKKHAEDEGRKYNNKLSINLLVKEDILKRLRDIDENNSLYSHVKELFV